MNQSLNKVKHLCFRGHLSYNFLISSVWILYMHICCKFQNLFCFWSLTFLLWNILLLIALWFFLFLYQFVAKHITFVWFVTSPLYEFIFFSWKQIFYVKNYLFWRIITFQYCDSFGNTSTWISHTCVPQILNLLYLPPQPIPLGCPRAPALGALLHGSNLHWSSVFIW